MPTKIARDRIREYRASRKRGDNYAVLDYLGRRVGFSYKDGDRVGFVSTALGDNMRKCAAIVLGNGWSGTGGNAGRRAYIEAVRGLAALGRPFLP